MSYFAQINKLINWIKTTEYKFDSKSDYIKNYNRNKFKFCDINFVRIIKVYICLKNKNNKIQQNQPN